MQDDTEAILSKIRMVIDTTEDKHREMANRYICLANKRIHRDIEKRENKDDTWGIIGACMGLDDRWKAKFGYFKIMSKPIIVST